MGDKCAGPKQVPVLSASPVPVSNYLMARKLSISPITQLLTFNQVTKYSLYFIGGGIMSIIFVIGHIILRVCS